MPAWVDRERNESNPELIEADARVGAALVCVVLVVLERGHPAWGDGAVAEAVASVGTV